MDSSANRVFHRALPVHRLRSPLSPAGLRIRLRRDSLNYWRFDYGPDQKSRPGGSAGDDRALMDVTRLALELEAELLPQVELEAEVEFEHGGTGGALELEYEEFGEFEQEVEKGGEVILEELYIKRSFGDLLDLSAGHFYVAVGLLSDLYRPLDYFGTVRPESEAAAIPALWHETGIEASGRVRRWRWRLQVINGLDATGFSSQRWVAGGHQLRFEQVRADRLALAGRVDFEPVRGALVGVSLYRGDSAGNRPKPDMEGTEAQVTIADVHAHLDRDRLRARGLFLRGHLRNAAAVSARNAPSPTIWTCGAAPWPAPPAPSTSRGVRHPAVAGRTARRAARPLRPPGRLRHHGRGAGGGSSTTPGSTGGCTR